MSILAKLVPPEAVKAELIGRMANGRSPQILDENSDDYVLYEVQVEQICSEVVPICGDPPEDPMVRALAVRCVAIGVARSIEAALYPAQLNQDASRGQQLQTMYVALLAQLRQLVADRAAATNSTFQRVSSFRLAPPQRPWW